MRMRCFVQLVGVVCGITLAITAQTPSTTPLGGSSPITPAQTPGSQFPAQTSGLPGQTPGSGTNPQTPTSGVKPTTLPSGGGENQLFIELKLGYNYADINPGTLGPDGRP